MLPLYLRRTPGSGPRSSGKSRMEIGFRLPRGGPRSLDSIILTSYYYRRLNQEGRRMSVIRWDPFRELMTLQDRMNRLFEEANRGWRTSESPTAAWSPAVDIYETEAEI